MRYVPIYPHMRRDVVMWDPPYQDFPGWDC